MRRKGIIVGAAVVAALAGCAILATTTTAVVATAEPCGERAEPLRYPDVADVFEAHCNKCHDKAQSDNEAAMRVFEASSYPFATERPETLLVDLREMFEERSGLSDEQRCRALEWLDTGGLDADGNRPASYGSK